MELISSKKTQGGILPIYLPLVQVELDKNKIMKRLWQLIHNKRYMKVTNDYNIVERKTLRKWVDEVKRRNKSDKEVAM